MKQQPEVAVKKINIINSPVDIYAFTPPQKGTFMGIDMSIGDIKRTLDQGVKIEEVLKDRTTIQLNYSNFDKNNTERNIHRLYDYQFIITNEMGADKVDETVVVDEVVETDKVGEMVVDEVDETVVVDKIVETDKVGEMVVDEVVETDKVDKVVVNNKPKGPTTPNTKFNKKNK